MRGIFEITKVNGTSIGGGTGFSELTGIYDLTVISEISSFGTFVYTFGSSIALEAVEGTGVAIVMYEDASPNYTAAGPSLAADEAAAMDGAFYWNFGFATPVDFWRLTTSFNLTALGGLPAGTPIGSFDFGLHLISNNSGNVLTSEPCPNASVMVDACGSGTLTATRSTSGWEVFDPLQIGITTVPEPNILTLLGIGLAAFGARSVRRVDESARKYRLKI